jgi:hypothetical protein
VCLLLTETSLFNLLWPLYQRWRCHRFDLSWANHRVRHPSLTLPSQNRLCHSKIVVRLNTASPQAFWISSTVFVAEKSTLR